MEVRRIKKEDREDLKELLLLADEQWSMVKRYLYRGEMYGLFPEGGLNAVSICVVTKEDEQIYEIKNFATAKAFQRKGYGRMLMKYVIGQYRGAGGILYVGTGNTSSTIGFYESCGFTRSHVVRNFFTDNYDHPIFEDGIQLRDMIYLSMKL